MFNHDSFLAAARRAGAYYTINEAGTVHVRGESCNSHKTWTGSKYKLHMELEAEMTRLGKEVSSGYDYTQWYVLEDGTVIEWERTWINPYDHHERW